MPPQLLSLSNLFHHTCAGFKDPWWRPQKDCIVCRIKYLNVKPTAFPYGDIN